MIDMEYVHDETCWKMPLEDALFLQYVLEVVGPGNGLSLRQWECRQRILADLELLISRLKEKEND